MLLKGLKADLISLLIILLVPLLIIGGALIPGRTLLPADLLSGYAAWQGSFDNPKVTNGLLSDTVLQFYPWHQLAYDNARETGHFPLWNPYELTGQPLVANAQSALFYPPNLLLHWFRPEAIAALSAYFNLLLLGISTFYFCREINLRKTACLFAAITVMLSGPVIVWLGYPIVNSLASFPLMLLAGEKIVNGRRLIPWSGALGVAIGLSILGGHPETTFNICFAFSLYFLFRLIAKKPGLTQGLFWLGAVLGGIFIGLFIGAIQWMPFTEFLFQSATLTEGGRSMGGANILFSKDWLYNLSTIVTFLIPNFFGSPVAHNYLWPFPNYQNYNEQTVYFGLIPMAFALSVLFNRRRRPQATILIGISFFFLAVAWRLPGFELVNHIPPFSILLNSRLKMIVPLLMAIVAGIGLDDWLNAEQEKQPRAGNKILSLLPVLITLVLFGGVYCVNLLFSRVNFQNSTMQAFIEHLVYQVFNINQARIMISLAAAVIFLILCLLFWRRLINGQWFGYAIITFTLIELVVLSWQYNPAIGKSLVYPEIPIASLAKQESQPFRIMSTDLALFPPNAGAAYQIAQVEGYDYPIFQSEFDLYQAQGGDKASHRQVWSADYPLVDWLNIRYVISPVAIQKNGYQLVIDQPAYKVYRNENAYPRATMAYEYQIIEDRTKLLQTMISSPEILKHKVLFNQLPADIPAVGAQTGGVPAQVDFADYSMDRAVINVNSPAAGFLVMSDLYTKDWKAKIDDKEVPVLNADYAYRAVYLPEGQHQVEFYYHPASFTIGKSLSQLGVLIVFVCCIFEINSIRRQKKNAAVS